MKKNIILLGALISSAVAYAQVGINTETPKATLDITAKPADLTKVDGLIAPRLKGSDLKAKDGLYETPQSGTIVYVTEALAAADTTTKTANVTALGYYYFDGEIWQAFKGAAAGLEPWNVESTTTPATANNQNIYQNGNLGLGDFSTANPIAKLDVRGAVRGGVPHAEELNGTSPIGVNSVAFGTRTKSNGLGSIAMGYETTAGLGSIPEDGSAGAVAMGFNTTATGQGAVAMGEYTNASARNTFAMGYQTHATGFGSVALGVVSTASGQSAIATGHNTEAIGNGSVAMGENTIASGLSSFAVNRGGVATGDYSFAAGLQTKANGYSSTAMGFATEANGWNSTAMGYYTHANGRLSFAMGTNLVAASHYEIVIGVGNAIRTTASAESDFEPTDALFQIGNSMTTSNSNALTILKSGKTKIGGRHTTKPDLTLEVEGTDGMKVPVGTTAQRPATAAFGTLRYNTTTGRGEMYVNDANGDGTQGDAGWRAF